MYLPKSKYKGDLFTPGNEFVVAQTGENYQGTYFETFDNRYFTGNNPSNSSQELIPNATTQTYGDNKEANRTAILEEYDIIRNNQKEFNLKSTDPIPVYYPNPTSQDYTRGNFVRYFLRNRSIGTIIEVSKEVYKAIIDKTPKYYYPGYTTGRLTWRIRGPLNTVTRQGYPQAGAKSINKAAVEKLELTLPGVSLYLSSLGQFVR